MASHQHVYRGFTGVSGVLGNFYIPEALAIIQGFELQKFDFHSTLLKPAWFYRPPGQHGQLFESQALAVAHARKVDAQATCSGHDG
jgi:hypothetical protein